MVKSRKPEKKRKLGREHNMKGSMSDRCCGNDKKINMQGKAGVHCSKSPENGSTF